GIRVIVLRLGKRGGRLRIVGGRANWSYALATPQTSIAVILTVGPARWCAEFSGPLRENTPARLVAESSTPPVSCPCGFVRSTWEGIQTAIFARHGCTQAICHGSTPGQGGLDLRPSVAYANLIGVPSAGSPDVPRVRPLVPSESMLWRKLAAGTLAGS